MSVTLRNVVDTVTVTKMFKGPTTNEYCVRFNVILCTICVEKSRGCLLMLTVLLVIMELYSSCLYILTEMHYISFYLMPLELGSYHEMVPFHTGHV